MGNLSLARRQPPTEPHADLQRDNDARACRAAVWIALLEADRLQWTDVRDGLYQLHAVVTNRVHRADYDQWRRLLLTEGPNQPRDDDA